MVLVVLGIDALDPDLVDPTEHPNLTLECHKPIGTINSAKGEPSTHELWPSIITGLEPEKHGLTLEDGVAWENPVLRYGSSAADYLLPDRVQTAIGAWLLNQTDQDAFRVPATYYSEHGIETIFDGRRAATIGIPNYVTDPNVEDREHSLRRQMGDLFRRDPGAKGGHTSSDPETFYERCLEMVMVRVARTRHALRSQRHELVFGYTSGLDLIGHIAYQSSGLQESAYEEVNDVVGELREDLGDDDELLLVSDHGLQDGLHTEEAMVAATAPRLCDSIESVTDVKDTINRELRDHNHEPRAPRSSESDILDSEGSDVRDQLEDLGYM
jgi:predicted AlkP superfamily pyrophosphatase or phosphodiesterase